MVCFTIYIEKEKLIKRHNGVNDGSFKIVDREAERVKNLKSFIRY